ncbi:MAG: hypothetical protein ACLRZ9_05905 [Eubacterium sp.]
MEFVTDRTYSDAEKVSEFEKRGWQNLEEEERKEWISGMKGALNYTDLNRIQENTLEIYIEYLKQNNSQQYVPNGTFVAKQSYIIAILTKGNSGDMFKAIDESEYVVLHYGINIVPVTINATYVTEIAHHDNVYLFGSESVVDLYGEDYSLAFNLYFEMKHEITQSILLPTLKAANYCGLLVNRPALNNSQDYRSVGITGAISTDFNIDFNRINEYELSLMLSYNWIFNKKITMPMDWNLSDSDMTSKYILSCVPTDGLINIKIPKGFYLSVVYGYYSHGNITSVQGQSRYITDGNDISFITPSYQFSYQFVISNYYSVSENITLTTLSNSDYIDCFVAEKLLVMRNSGTYSSFVLYLYDKDINLIKTISSCDFDSEIDVLEYHYIQIMVPGISGGSTNLTYVLTNSCLKDISELNTDEMEIIISKK